MVAKRTDQLRRDDTVSVRLRDTILQHRGQQSLDEMT